LLLYLARDLMGVWTGARGVGFWAHIGGFLFGALLAWVVKLTRLEECGIAPGIEARIAFRQHPAVERAFALRLAGRGSAALRVAEAALPAAPRNLFLLREAFDAAVASRNLARAALHASRLVEELGSRCGADDVAETRAFIEEATAVLDPASAGRFRRVVDRWRASPAVRGAGSQPTSAASQRGVGEAARRAPAMPGWGAAAA
jgi:hypothetical protein